MLAKGARLDDLWGLQRSITAAVLAGGADVDSPGALVEAWQASNGRTIERAGQLLGELRAVPAPDAAMLAVALRELRGLT
jgi:glutamate dehydrogenase